MSLMSHNCKSVEESSVYNSVAEFLPQICMGLNLSPPREKDLGIRELINAKEENYYANKIVLSYGAKVYD